MHLLLVTDAWFPQINGVVRTLSTVVETLRADGHRVDMITPDRFPTVPLPSYPEIRLALMPGRRVAAQIDAARPDAVHIATEGPLGGAARRHCLRRGLPFTTSFHTKFPEYIRARIGLPVRWSYAWLRRFHAPAERVMVATPTIRRELAAWGIANTVLWSRGVDTDLFRPRPAGEAPPAMRESRRPISLYTGRVAVEKNVAAFLDCPLEGTKVVIGDGPQASALKSRYPDVRFLGAKHGEDLARHFAAADLFVFPSRTDTFGLVMLEALASGVPVAAYPVPGPLDVIADAPVGCLDESLDRAAARALAIDREACRAYALDFSWKRCADLFLSHLAPIPAAARAPVTRA